MNMVHTVGKYRKSIIGRLLEKKMAASTNEAGKTGCLYIKE